MVKRFYCTKGRHIWPVCRSLYFWADGIVTRRLCPAHDRHVQKPGDGFLGAEPMPVKRKGNI